QSYAPSLPDALPISKPSAASSARAARSTPWPYAFALTTAHSLAPLAYAFATRRLCASAPAEMVARIGRGISQRASGSVLCEVLRSEEHTSELQSPYD